MKRMRVDQTFKGYCSDIALKRADSVFDAHRIRRTWSRKVHKFLKSSCKIQLSQGLTQQTIDENMDSYELGLKCELKAPKAHP